MKTIKDLPRRAVREKLREKGAASLSEERAGVKFEKFTAGVWRQQYQYKSFQPTLVDQQWTWEDPSINALLEQATKALGS